jgi:hypothetical protein
MAQPRLFMTFSREEIYTNLETRIHYLHSFIDFSSSKSLSSIYSPHSAFLRILFADHMLK